MRSFVALAAAAMLAVPATAAVYFRQTVTPSSGFAYFNGGFGDSTAYPHSVLGKTFTVTLSGGGIIDEINWSFDVVQQSLWYERFDLSEPFYLNGNEYDTPTNCDVFEGDSCSTYDGTVALSSGQGQVTQAPSPTGYNNCAALLPLLQTNDFVGVSQDCAETYQIGHVFDIYASNAGAGPVTLTISGPPVPEPATWALLVTGFIIAGAAVRRRRLPVAA